MATVTIQEAQARLSDLIHQLSPGEEVVITENNQPWRSWWHPEQKSHAPFPAVARGC